MPARSKSLQLQSQAGAELMLVLHAHAQSLACLCPAAEEVRLLGAPVPAAHAAGSQPGCAQHVAGLWPVAQLPRAWQPAQRRPPSRSTWSHVQLHASGCHCGRAGPWPGAAGCWCRCSAGACMQNCQLREPPCLLWSPSGLRSAAPKAAGQQPRAPSAAVESAQTVLTFTDGTRC